MQTKDNIVNYLTKEVDKMFESKNVDDKTKKVENDMQRN